MKHHQNNKKKAPICFEVISYLFHSVPSVAIEFDKQVLHLPYPLPL